MAALQVTIRPTEADYTAADALARKAVAGGAANPFDQFDAAPGPAANPFDQFDGPTSSAGGSAVRGALQGLTFGTADEMAGVAAAAPQGVQDTIGKVPLLGPVANFVTGGINLLGQGEGAQSRYDQAVTDQRAQLEADSAQHPIASAVGNIGGALATAPFLGALNIVRAPAMIAEAAPVLARAGNAALRLGARGANSALTGAAYGGAYGLGTGEGDLGERAPGALQSVGTGAALGAAGTVAGAGLRAAGGAFKGAGNLVGGLVNPDKMAAKVVGRALAADKVNPVTTAAGIAKANAGGIPYLLADVGGEATRAVARSAANASPEARNVINTATGDRFASQGERFSDFVRGLVGGTNVTATQDALKAAAQKANKPAYAKAYRDGAGGVWTSTLEQLTTSPDMQAAVASAARTGANKAAVGGLPAPVNPFKQTPAGLVLKGASQPSVQFWDLVKQNLDGIIAKAQRDGDTGRVRDLTAIKTQLVSELDAAVPSYASARAGAAAFFGAQDALEAGQRFVTSRLDNTAAAKALAKMSPPERALFAEGFASELINRVKNTPDNRDILNAIFLKASASRERIEMALGKPAAAKLEAFLLTESIMDMLRKAMGNSTTARQLAERGLLTGAAAQATGAGALGFVLGGGNVLDVKSWSNAIIFAALTRGKGLIEASVAKRVANLLTSSDPGEIQSALGWISKNPRVMGALKGAGDYIQRAIISTGAERAPTAPAAYAQADGNTQ